MALRTSEILCPVPVYNRARRVWRACNLGGYVLDNMNDSSKCLLGVLLSEREATTCLLPQILNQEMKVGAEEVAVRIFMTAPYITALLLENRTCICSFLLGDFAEIAPVTMLVEQPHHYNVPSRTYGSGEMFQRLGDLPLGHARPGQASKAKLASPAS